MASELGRAGAYELLIDLASGGMATVYLARATDRDLLVAIKRPHKHLAQDKMFLTMLLDEARLASAIDHPNVVRVRELAFESGEPFIVLDYIEGCALSDLRKELAAADRALATKVAVRIMLDALAGLHAAHELRDKETGKPLGIIHRDISPHNVLVGADGTARLTDFGIAKAEDRLQVTRTHEVKGKLAYLAPERVDKRRTCTRQSDLFSIGIVLWECLAGRRLFRGDEAMDTLEEVMHAPIPRLRQLGAHVPPALDDVISRVLSRDLNVRYKTAAEVAMAIERAAGRGNIGTPQEVAEVVDVVFGGRLRLRHQQLRGVLGQDVTARVLRGSGVSERHANTDPLVPSPHLLASIAPAAPTQRYAFGGLKDVPLRRERRWLVPLFAGTAAGVVIGSVGIGVLASRRSTQATSHTTPIVVNATTIAAPSPTFSPAPAMQSTIDEANTSNIELDNAPIPTSSAVTAGPVAPVRRRAAPIGTTHNGFTKLR